MTSDDHKIYEILKGIAWEVNARKAILRSAGFPSEHIPTNSASSDEFWDEINDRIVNGLVPLTHRQIYEAAAERYKGNPSLRRFRKSEAMAADPVIPLPEQSDAEPLLILCASSSPLGLGHMDTGFEVRALDEVSQRHATKLRLRKLDAVTFDDLRRELLNANPHVLHFSGHADREGALFLHGERFGYDRVDGEFITDLLAVLRSAPTSRLRIVFLNACFSHALSSIADAAKVDVIGWDGAVYDGEVTAVSRVFYESYAVAQDVEMAFKLANQALALERQKTKKERVGPGANLCLVRPPAAPDSPPL